MPMQLLVNIDHIATLRNARGEGYPVPAQAAQICEKAGAAGIVFHLRGDRRHIMDHDLSELKESVQGVLDFEMAATEEMIALLHQVQPDICTLVPEGREELTTEGGLHLAAVFEDFKTRVFPAIRNGAAGSKVEISLFVDPNPDDIQGAIELGSDAIELHTGTYANAIKKRQGGFSFNNLCKEMRCVAGHCQCLCAPSVKALCHIPQHWTGIWRTDRLIQNIGQA